jgi:hypothetical protein
VLLFQLVLMLLLQQSCQTVSLLLLQIFIQSLSLQLPLLVDGVAAAAAVTAVSPSWQISPRSGRHPDQSAATTETTISSDINPGAYISKQLF